jgi:hypothetical protein
MDAEALAVIRRLLAYPDPGRRADTISEASHWAVLAWAQHCRRPPRERLLAALEAAAGAMALAGLAPEEDGRQRG